MLRYADAPEITYAEHDADQQLETIEFKVPTNRLTAFSTLTQRADAEELTAWSCSLLGREFDLPRCRLAGIILRDSQPRLRLVFGPPWYSSAEAEEKYVEHGTFEHYVIGVVR